MSNQKIDIRLNNTHAHLGTFKDVHFSSTNDPINLEYKFTDDKIFTLNSANMNNPEDGVISFNVSPNVNNLIHYMSKLLPFYVAADRLSPKSFYLNPDKNINNDIGVLGEHTAFYLATKGTTEKVTNRSALFPDLENSEVSYQAEAWLSMVSPKIKFAANKINSDISTMEYFYLNKYRYTPNNVGFGLSYTLPIIVALLKAKPDSTLIIENPEGHLHPKGQRRMGEFIAKVASGGVQIILETHSDHILNGICLAVKHQNIKPEQVKINYFYVDENGKHDKQSPEVKADGSLTDWPEGFFDEWDLALSELLS
jgi:predicted ATPase